MYHSSPPRNDLTCATATTAGVDFSIIMSKLKVYVNVRDVRGKGWYGRRKSENNEFIF